jgi:HSP20 family protein
MPPISATADPPFQNLGRPARHLMDQLQKGYYNFAPSDTWTPSVNLYETPASFLVCVDLAGVEKDKIDVEVHDGKLRLRGTRPVPMCEPVSTCEQTEAEPKRVRVHLMEIDHGSFSREVELPPNIARERITATYRNGMLWIEIPKE